ncbi:MAG: hypothetical protein QM302_04520 [Acidobacteriota bacterium]|nr:hypothetical protein [Acidobacteriota bacterium]
MARLRGLVMLAACAVFACLMVAACGNASEAVDYGEAFVGTYEICEMTEDGEVTGADDLKLLSSAGLHVYLDLDADGTGVLELFGRSMSGTWEASGSKKATITIDGQAVDMTLDGEGILALSQDSQELKFRRIDPSEKEEAATAQEEAA